MLYAQKYARRVKLFERRFTRPVYDVLQASMKEAADAYRNGRLQDYLNSLVMLKVGPVIQQLYVEVGVWSARKTLREINAGIREDKGFGFDEKWTQAIIRLYLLNKAVLPITQTQREHILSVLEQGQKEGWGVDRTAFELENSGLTLSRARMIVRTEIAKAQNRGRELGREESPFETDKQWISAHDHRTRHSHREIDGEQIPVNGKFKVNIYKRNVVVGFDMMNGPGDPEASAANVINCRCTVADRARRDENGRLIRKRSIQISVKN